jgi:hypothetical protein
MSAVITRLLGPLGRLWTSFWGRRSLVALKSEEKDRALAEARGRFWTEFREGQREAEAHGSRPR